MLVDNEYLEQRNQYDSPRTPSEGPKQRISQSSLRACQLFLQVGRQQHRTTRSDS